MAKPSDFEDWDALKKRVIGLGERSFQKSYYPQLRENLDRLERFHALLDRTTDFVVLVALPEAVVYDANAAFGKLLSEPVRALIGRPFASLGLGKVEEALDKLREDMTSWKPSDDISSQPFVVEFGFGEGRTWLELTCHIATLDERFYGVIVGRDITERKKAQEMVTALLAEKEALLDNALVGIVMVRNRQIVSCNRRFEEMFGYPAGALIGQKTRVLYKSDEDFAASGEDVYRSLSSGQGHTFTLTLVHRDGSLFWCQVTGRAIDPEKPQEGSIWTFTDVTRRKQAEFHLRESEEKFRVFVEAAADAYFIHDTEGRIIEVNKMACESLGYTREELLQMSVFDVDPDSDPKYAKQVWRQPASGNVITIPSRHCRKDGTCFSVEVRISSILIGGQRLFLALVRNIDERQKAEEELKLAAAVYRYSSEAMMVLDENRNIIMVNQAFTDITGYDPADVIGQHPRLLRIGRPGGALYKEDDAFYQDLWRQADKTGRFKGETWHKKKDGQFIAVQLTVNVIADESGQPRRYVVLESDITDKKRSDDLIWSQANFDTLTGLPNRRFFRERLEHEIRNAKRSNLPLALLFIDLDGFKDVNDTLGHDMGDLLLKEAADRLRGCVRESDTIARLGGDEFTIILTELHDFRNVDRVARHILRVLAEPVKLGEELAYVSASIGITLFPNDTVQVEDLIKNADQAMYAAKESGRNQYHYFTQAMQDTAIARMRLINDLRGALEDNQFEIVYQPIIDMITGKIHKAEALIRWQHPVQGLINPIDFISAAEDTGMITAFGNWVFHEAARQVAAWRERYHSKFQISVNISPVQFKKEGIDPAVWFEHLKNLDLPGQGIVVEITEGLLLDASPKVKDQLLLLRDAGIEVALDDFGTGYSSLAYLQKYNIDYVKIDQAFVRNLAADSNELALCEAMIVMAHKLNIKVIAEGVEGDRQYELLANSGCDFAQGYFFSRPVSVGEFERLLDADPFSFQESLNI